MNNIPRLEDENCFWHSAKLTLGGMVRIKNVLDRSDKDIRFPLVCTYG